MANWSWKFDGSNHDGLWSQQNHWSHSGGSTGGHNFPNSLSSDNATLGALTGSYTVTVDGAYAVRSLTMAKTSNAGFTTTLDITAGHSLHVGTSGIAMGYNTVINVEGSLTNDGSLGLASGNFATGYSNPQVNLAGGTYDMTNAYTYAGTTYLDSHIGFDFSGGNGTFDFGTTGFAPYGDYTISNAVTGFGAGDAIDLTGVLSSGFMSFGYATSGAHSITVTLSAFGNPFASFTFDNITTTGGTLQAISDGNGGVEIVVCYQAGTHILTPRGEVAVEDQREGDLVTTFSGRGPIHKPITWIGQMRESLDGHPDPEKAAPVRIRVGAVAENVPHRDLLVSPDHAICLDGVLIPAKELVNGVTITQELDFGEVQYFHIELEQHDIVLAEGLTAESYLDTGNRDAFAAYRVTPFVAQDEEIRVS
jgi:hypothetical protein